VSRRARERLTVALVGEGSDETNIGYRSFLDLSRMVRRRRFGRLLPFAPRSGRWAHRLGFPALDDAGFLARFTNLAMPMHRFPPLLPHLTAPAERIREEVQRLAPDEHLSPFERNRQFRISGWMRDDLLVKVDKTTMAASIEARVPFLDHTYLEWAVTLPERFVLRNGQTKSVLRAIAERLLPPRIAGRKQHGLIVPLMAMLRSADARELREQLLSGKALWRRVFVEAPVRQIIDRFDAGDTSVFIYQLAQAELWQAHWLERHAASHAGVAG